MRLILILILQFLFCIPGILLFKWTHVPAMSLCVSVCVFVWVDNFAYAYYVTGRHWRFMGAQQLQLCSVSVCVCVCCLFVWVCIHIWEHMSTFHEHMYQVSHRHSYTRIHMYHTHTEAGISTADLIVVCVCGRYTELQNRFTLSPALSLSAAAAAALLGGLN